MEKDESIGHGARKSYFIPPVSLLMRQDHPSQRQLKALIKDSDPSINIYEAGQTAAALKRYVSSEYRVEHPRSGREVLSTHISKGMTWGGGDAIDFFNVLHDGGASKLQALRIVTLFTYLTDETPPMHEAVARENMHQQTVGEAGLYLNSSDEAESNLIE